MDDMVALWGENIRRLREAQGLDREALAAKIGVREPTVFRWEQGTMEPRRPMKVRIAEALGTDAHELFPLTATV